MHDSTLVGIWKSDAQKTAREITARGDLPDSKKRKLRSLFGKLELRYTRTRSYAKYGGEITISRYTVVAKDSSSIAIVNSNSISKGQIFLIHFEDNLYWISLGRIREFFKRKSLESLACVYG